MEYVYKSFIYIYLQLQAPLGVPWSALECFTPSTPGDSREALECQCVDSTGTYTFTPSTPPGVPFRDSTYYLPRVPTVTTINHADLLTPGELAARLKVPQSWVYEKTRARSREASS